MQLDHVGIAVRDLDASVALHARKLGGRVMHRERLDTEGVEVAFVGRTELLAPLPGSSGPLARFLAERGEGLHHVAYRVGDLDAELAALSARGLDAVAGYPRRGARGFRVAFLHPKSCGGVLVELCEPD
ncbi:MAG: methylmalonyl-CoA epimerase [Planctomycetes bacterium]|nr:methylmalonyl-CoA epimerase [Planctomycetota bacterium]